ncbi:MAG: hypothetical protein SGPRY_013694, partial [Prymnesium sp.]
SERVRKLSLKRRLVRYYQIHAPNSPPSERKLAKLLSKYGRDAEHELEEALRAKYGSGTLPAEDYRQLFARELIGPSIYLLSSRAASWRDGWIAPAHLSALHSAWAECRPSEKLLLLAVLWAFAASLSSSLARPLVTLTFLLAICQLVAPQPSTLAPSSLVADAHHSWLRAEGGERVGLLSAAHLIAYALLGPAHLTPCIFAWLGSALVATSPTPPQAYEGMAFVHPSARGAVRAAAQPGTGLKLSTLELGPISFVVLQVGEGESMWQVRDTVISFWRLIPRSSPFDSLTPNPVRNLNPYPNSIAHPNPSMTLPLPFHPTPKLLAPLSCRLQ